jgi:hypothetical protein
MTPISKGLIRALVILVAPVAVLTQDKPTRNAEMIVDYSPPPATLDELVEGADAVVVGSIQSVRTYQPPIPYASVRLLYTVEISEVLRIHAALNGSVVQVYRFGGDIDQGDHVTRKVERDFPRFTVGKQYVMFLSWNHVLNGFEPQFGPNGVFELIADGKVDTPGQSAVARSQKGKTAAALIAQVKRAASM